MLLNKHNLNLWKFCCKEDSRYMLRALLATKNETVATDGHLLVRVTTPKLNESLFPNVEGFAAADIEGDVLINADVAKEIADSIPKGEQTIPILNNARLAKGENGVRAVTTDLDLQHVVQGREVVGQFPKWEHVIPHKKPIAEVVVNASLLASIAQFAAKLSDSTSVRIQLFGPESAIRLDAEDVLNGQGMTAALMPMRHGSTWEYGYKAK